MRYDLAPDSIAEAELKAGLPFLEINVVRQDDFDYLVDRHFASDRDFVLKGMVEVHL